MPPALLPSGLRDLLPPDAARQQRIVSTLLEHFAARDYKQVMPPLVEFEDTLLSGKGAALTTQTFRFLDPLSGKMLALRSDMTVQVARIAATRLGSASAPLRLSYAGNVLRVQPERLEGTRQLTQAGIELIGSAAPEADAEVILVLLEALAALGCGDMVVDLSLAGLLDALLAGENEPAKQQVHAAVKNKDAAHLPPLAQREAFQRLMGLAGPADAALAALEKLKLPPEAEALAGQLAAVKAALAILPHVTLTIDPLEHAHLEYHRGVCFSLYLTRTRKEIGRGGRYSITQDSGAEAPATGGTLYVGRLLEAVTE